MKFLGLDVLQAVVSFFQSLRSVLTLEYLLYIFVGLEVLTILLFIVIVHYVYELRLMRAVDRINAYLYEVQYIDETNLIEFNNMMKRVPKILRYHWQQYMLYREKSPSYYMSVENCVDRPIKSSAFSANIKVVKSLGILYAILSLIFCLGWTAGTAVSTDFFIAVTIIPLVILFLNHILLIGLDSRRASNTKDLYQTFHIFNRFIDKAVSTLPEYVDFEVLFTQKEIRRGIPVLNEYIEKRQIQEQEEMKKAKENAVKHEIYNFEEAGDKGELVLERAMKETEILVNLKNRLNAEIDQIDKEIESYKRTYENTTKDYQRKLQASKENVERLREQQESTTNRIESNYIRKQQADEIKKQQQIEKDQEDATLRFNQEINNLTAEIKKRKDEIEVARQNVEKAMSAEYKTFSEKIFNEIKEDVSNRVKNERENLIKARESIAKDLEESLSRVEQLEKQNKILVTKTGEREAFIRAEIGKENEILMQKINDLNEIIKQKDEHISLITENPNLKIKPRKIEAKIERKQKSNLAGKTIIEGEFSFDDLKKDGDRFKAGFEGPVGKFDSQGNYRYENGTYYDTDGFFHDEKGNVYDPEGNFVDKNSKPKVEDIKSDIIAKIKKEDKKEEIILDKNNEFSDFDVDEEDDDGIVPKDKINKEETKPATVEVEAEVKPKGKPGRPRKPKTEEPKIPKKRGRPRKEKKEEDLKPKRKRGRPRKIVLTTVPEQPKRGRGRPRKIVLTTVPEQPKRGRGRPRKEKVEESKIVKKGRGRPRKIQEEPKKIKKGRGRPKKIDLNDLKEIEKKIKEQNNILKGQKTDLKKTLKKATKK